LLLKPDKDRFEIIDANNTYCEVTGSLREELTGLGLFEAFPANTEDTGSDGVPNLRLSLLTVPENGIPHRMNRQKYDIPVRGTERFEVKYWDPVNIPVFDEQGEMVCIIHSVKDVTREVLAEEKEKKLGADREKVETRLEEAQKIARIGNWEVDLVNNSLYWSDMIREIHEVKPGYQPQLETAVELYKEGTHRNRIRRAVEKAIETGELFDLELVIITAKGNERWVRATEIAESVKEQQCLYRILKLDETERRIPELLQKAIGIIPEGWQYPAVTGAQITWNDRRAETSQMPGSAELIESDRDVNGKLMKVRVWYNKKMPRKFDGPFLKEEVDLLNSIADNIAMHIRQIESRIHLEKKTEELARSNRELEQFAFVTSHNMQESLRMITSFLTQLERKYGETFDERAESYIRFAKQGAERMRNVILGLLDYSRVGADDEPEKIDLNNLVQEVTHDLRKLIDESGADLVIPELPVVESYRVLLQHLFYNLLHNALKYGAEAENFKIEICLKESDNGYTIGVRDNGPGIAGEYHQKIFELFQRLQNVDDTGTGIGLAICKKSAGHLGGTIRLESATGKGSTFWFTIPHKT